METPEEKVARIVAERGGKGKADVEPTAPSVPRDGRNPDGTFVKGVVPEGATPFPPGVSGNPAGRPRMASALIEVGEQPDPLTGMPRVTAAATAMWNKACAGDVQAYREIADRTEGKVSQGVEITGANGGPIAHADATDETLEAYAQEAVALAAAAFAAGDEGGAAPCTSAPDGTR